MMDAKGKLPNYVAKRLEGKTTDGKCRISSGMIEVPMMLLKDVAKRLEGGSVTHRKWNIWHCD